MTEPAGTGTPEPSDDPPSPRAWLTRNLLVLSAVSFLQDTASELVYPILPIFITVVLGAPAAVLGSIEGLADGISAIVSPFSGAASDRIGRKPLIAAGYGLAALGKVLVALATAWPTVLVARSADRFGKGLRGSPRDALIADGVNPTQRGKAFGFHRAMDTSGAVAGPLIGLVAYEALNHQIRPLLWIAVIPAVLSVALVAFVHDPLRDRFKLQSEGRAETPHPVRIDTTTLPPLPSTFRRVVAILTVFSLVNFPDALLLLRLRSIGFSVAMTILAYATYNIVYAMFSYPAGALSDRLSRSRIYAVGLAFFSLGYIGLGLTQDVAVGVGHLGRVWDVRRMHRRSRQGVGVVTRRSRPPGSRAGRLPRMHGHGDRRGRGLGRTHLARHRRCPIAHLGRHGWPVRPVALGGATRHAPVRCREFEYRGCGLSARGRLEKVQIKDSIIRTLCRSRSSSPCTTERKPSTPSRSNGKPVWRSRPT